MKVGGLGLKGKIMSGSIVPLLIIAFLGTAGVMTLRFLTSSIQSMDEIGNLKQRITVTQRSVVDMERVMLAYLLSGQEDDLKRYKSASARVSAELADLRKKLHDAPKEQKKVEDAKLAVGRWQTNYAKPAIESRTSTVDSTTLSRLYRSVSEGEAGKQLEKATGVLNSLRTRADTLDRDHMNEAAYYATLMENLVLYGLTLTIILALVINYVIAHRITSRLGSAIELAIAIGKGDLTQRLHSKSKDEIGLLGTWLDKMVGIMTRESTQMLDVVSVLSNSASEISTTAAQLAQSTSTTSTAVTQTTITVEEVKQAARIASEKSKDVARLAQESVKVSSDGRKATEETIQRMNLIKEQMESVGETVVRLSEHSRAIEEIIKTVQDLADQSNLLAVNASIEAARAGDHGKGFSIVAHEIKTLADQSKEATAQIRTILEETRKWVSAVVMATEQGTKAVGMGVEQSMRAGEAIASLSNSVSESAQAASVIQTSSEQQFSGVDQVSSAMTGIDKAVHQNLDGTQHLENAAQKLADLGAQLKQQVGSYKL